jgi:pyrroline-5-carboxylate reductase
MNSSGAATSTDSTIAFIGGGNMASALIGGLVQTGTLAAHIHVVEPHAPQREMLQQRFGVHALAAADASLSSAALVVWAVKPQLFREAAQPCAPFVAQALQLSVMAGIRCAAIEAATGTARIVRAMPNTPALIGQGMAGLYARPAVAPAERQQVERLFAPTGRSVWVADETDLDAVTALSGSGPAYGFYLIEAMVEAAQRMGLGAEQGREMAIQTVLGASMLAQQSAQSPAELRAQVTSKGGTTHAAISHLEARAVKETIVQALLAAQARARELGDEFGR